MASVAPLLISSVTATTISYIFTGTEPMFILHTIEPFAITRITWYIVLGLVCGFASISFTRGMNGLEQWFKRNIRSWGLKILVGGVTLGVLVFLFPPLYGEGYDVI